MTSKQKLTLRQHARISRLYRFGTIAFLAISLGIGAIIGIIAFTSTTIAITLGTHDVSETTTITVAEQPKENTDELQGTLLFATAEGTTVVEVPAAGTAVDDFAQGTITVFNNWTKTQPLAARTRFKASSNGLVYRSTKRIDVLPGGQVDVEVVADEAGARGNIPPDRFEIVALWQGLKDKIYGQSASSMTGGVRASSSVSQASIDNAMQRLEQQLMAEAADNAPKPSPDVTIVGEPILASSNVASQTNAGDSVLSFEVKGEVRTLQVGIDREALRKKVAVLLQEKLTADEEFVGNTPAVTGRILEWNEKNRSAVIELTVTNAARLAPGSDLFSPARFLRKTREEILQNLRGTTGVAAVEVRISPFWAKRSPSLQNQIRVVVTTATAP